MCGILNFDLQFNYICFHIHLNSGLLMPVVGALHKALWIDLCLKSATQKEILYFIIVCVLLSSDMQRLFHVDGRTSDTGQCGHRGSLWYASGDELWLLATFLSCNELPVFAIAHFRQADHDCGTSGLWEIFPLAGSTGWDAASIRNNHLEQVSCSFGH